MRVSNVVIESIAHGSGALRFGKSQFSPGYGAILSRGRKQPLAVWQRGSVSATTRR
jgi:hypothetical protein